MNTPDHVAAALKLFAKPALRYAPTVLIDPRVAMAQWSIETGWGRSAVFLGGQSALRSITERDVPTWNVAGMVHHREHFEGPRPIYKAGREWLMLNGELLEVPPTTAHHDGRQLWTRYRSIDEGAIGWAIRIVASPGLGDLRQRLLRQPPRRSWELQCRALGESAWSQSKYRTQGVAGAAPGSHLVTIVTAWMPAILAALSEAEGK